MATIKFTPAGHDEEKESGNVAMFGYGSRDLEDRKDFSCSFLADTVVRGLEIITIVFLLLIICGRIPVNDLVYILVPFTLTYLLASVASLAVDYGSDKSVNLSVYVSQFWKCTSAMRLCANLSLFGAKCALIYMYSKNMSNALNSFKSLSALSDIFWTYEVVPAVPIQYFTLSIVCICFIVIVESALSITKIIDIYDARGHRYTLALSLVDTIGISLYLLILRGTYQENEVIHSLKIISCLPGMFAIVSAARYVVCLGTMVEPRNPFVIPTTELPSTFCFGAIHIFVGIFNLISTLLATDSSFGASLLGLKWIFGVAITERVFLTVVHVCLGALNRNASDWLPNVVPPPGRISAPSSSSSSRPKKNRSAIRLGSSHSLSSANSGSLPDEQTYGPSMSKGDDAHQNDAREPSYQLEQASVERALAKAQVERRTQALKIREELELQQARKNVELTLLSNRIQNKEIEQDDKLAMIESADSIALEQTKELERLEAELTALQAKANTGENIADQIQQKVEAIAAVQTFRSQTLAGKSQLERDELQAKKEWERLSKQADALDIEIDALGSQIGELSVE